MNTYGIRTTSGGEACGHYLNDEERGRGSQDKRRCNMEEQKFAEVYNK